MTTSPSALPRSPLPGPKIEDMVEVEVREQGGNRRPLRGTLLAGRPPAVFDNSRVQPFLDEPQDPLVRDAMLDEPPHPSVVDGVVEPTDVSIEYPVHLPLLDPDRQRIQCIVRAAPGPVGWPGRSPHDA